MDWTIVAIWILFLYRNLGDGIIWMKCTLNIDLDIINRNKCIPYKYFVCSPEAEGYEYLYSAPSYYLPSNRNLWIPKMEKGKFRLESYNYMMLLQVK